VYGIGATRNVLPNLRGCHGASARGGTDAGAAGVLLPDARRPRRVRALVALEKDMIKMLAMKNAVLLTFLLLPGALAQSPQQRFCDALKDVAIQIQKIDLESAALNGPYNNPIEERTKKAQREPLESRMKALPDDFKTNSQSLLGPAMEIKDWKGTLSDFRDAGRDRIFLTVVLDCPGEYTPPQLASTRPYTWLNYINVNLVSTPPDLTPRSLPERIRAIQDNRGREMDRRTFPFSSPIVQGLGKSQVRDAIALSGKIVSRSNATFNQTGFTEIWEVVPSAITPTK
jgi:hypothetical protein